MPGEPFGPSCSRSKSGATEYVNPGAEPVIFQHTCGAEFQPLTVCADFNEPARDGELTVTGGTHPVEATM
jgi:hypothetical protein